jgi:hypothetical protein
MKALIQLAEHPFAFGAERIAYYGSDVTCARKPVDVVLKKYTGRGGSGSRGGFLTSAAHYETAIQVQTIAAYLADKFNEQLMAKVFFSLL